MKKMLKRIISVTLISAMSLSLMACGGGKGKDAATNTDNNKVETADNQDEKEETKKETKEVKTLSLLMFTDWWNNGGWEDVVNDINSRSDELGIKIEVEKIAGGDQGGQIIKSRYAAGELPDLQLYYNVNSAMIELGTDYFVEIGGAWTDNYDKDIIDTKACSYEGSVYGVPYGAVGVDGMYYNKKIFEQVGVSIPTSWDELLDVCEKIKAAGITPVYFSGYDPWTLQIMGIDAFERETQNGKGIAQVMDEINLGKSKYSDLTMVADGLGKMKELKDKGYINETFLSDTYDNAQEAIINGTAAMYPMASWVSAELVKKYPDQLDVLGAFPIPYDGETNAITAWGPNTLLVTKDADLEAAKIFVDYLGSKEGQQMFFKNISGVPLMSGVEAEATPPEKDLARYAEERGKVLVWSDLKAYDYGTFDKYCQDLLVDSKTPLEVLEEMDKETYKNAKAKGDPNFADK